MHGCDKALRHTRSVCTEKNSCIPFPGSRPALPFRRERTLLSLCVFPAVVCAHADTNAGYLLSNLPLGGRAGVDV